MKFKYIFFCIWMLPLTNVEAEVYIRDYTYIASEADSKITCRTSAIDQVKTLLLQEIGTHIRQTISVSKDGSGNSYSSEDVEALTAGLTKVDILEEKWNGESYYLKAKIEADIDSVLESLEEYKKSTSIKRRQTLDQLKESNRELQQSRKEIARLKDDLNSADTEIQKNELLLKYALELKHMSSSQMALKGSQYENKKQYEDAIYWYKKAAKEGDVLALNNLGWMYWLGVGFEKDRDQAIQLMKKAAEKGNDVSQNNIGFMYEFNEAGKEDLDRAIYWYTKSAAQGNTEALVTLGGFYYSGDHVGENMQLALDFYLKAAEKKNPDAAYMLSRYYLQRNIWDKKKSGFWQLKAAEWGNLTSQFSIGQYYMNGRNSWHEPFEKSESKALLWIKKSADQGNSNAQYKLGEMYQNGIIVEKDIIKAIDWYKKATVREGRGGWLVGAMYKLGEIYELGIDIDTDLLMAQNWYSKAAKWNSGKAKLALQRLKASGAKYR